MFGGREGKSIAVGSIKSINNNKKNTNCAHLLPELPHTENNSLTLNQKNLNIAHSRSRRHARFLFFFLLRLHFRALRLESPLQDGRCCAAKRQAGHRGADQQEALLAVLTNQTGPPPQEVTEQRLLLDQGAEGQQDVEDLMTLTNDVTATRKETLRDRTREERGQQN